MAKVAQADAQKTALASLKDPSKATVKSAELEAERGCLVYSFDIEVAGKTGVQEVQIDAGNGKVLSNKHESPKAEAAEKNQGQSEGAEKLMVGAPEPVLERFGALLRVRERLFRRRVPMLAPPELGVGESDPVRHLDAEGLDLGLVEKLDREGAAVPMEIAGADTLRAERGRPQELDPVRGRCGRGLPRHEKARHEVLLRRLTSLAQGGNDVGAHPRVAHEDADLRRLPVGLRLGAKRLFL